MILEKFVPIKGYEGLYEINMIGQVKIIGRIIVRGVRVCSCKDRIMKINNNRNGYPFVALRKNGVQKCYSIHRLVALHFIPNKNNYPVINHINGIRTDNRIENLEWCTQSKNVKHAYDIGVAIGPCKIRVRCTKTGKKWDSIADCSKETGISRSWISKCISGKCNNTTTFEKY